MIRTIALGSLVILLAGCTRYHSRAQGPFARHNAKDLPPAYGSGGDKPLANQSPLALAVPAPSAPSASDERPVVPLLNGAAPAAAVDPPELDDPNAFPPFRKRPAPKTGAMPSPLAPKTPDPEKPAPPAKGFAEVKALVATSNAAWKAVDTFEGTLTRREINPQGAPTSEVVLFQYRRDPMSVFTRTVSENGKGREIVYNPGKHGDKLHLMLGQGDHKLFKAGFMPPAVSPDDARVKEKSRYSIRDAGFGRHINKLADAVAKTEAGKVPADALIFRGPVKRDEYPYPLTGVTNNLRAGEDPLFPNGVSRTYFFDLKEKSPSYGLPVLIIATDSGGKEGEYYLFEKVKSPANLTDADFSPDRLGKK